MPVVAEAGLGQACAGVEPDLPSAMPLSSSDPASRARKAQVRLRHLVETNFDFIWRSLRGLGVPAIVVDDAAQQVFLIASRKLDEIDPGSERAFLFATARGIAANVRRSRSRSREDVDERRVDEQIDPSPNPEQAAARRQAHRILDRLLAEMPDDLRTTFLLFELEGLTMAAISELLKVPMGTVASRLRRARELFERKTAELHRDGERP